MNKDKVQKGVFTVFMIVCITLTSFGTLFAAENNPQGGNNKSDNPGKGLGIPIVTNGKADSIIIVAADASKQTLAAAQTLVEYVRKSTGAVLPVMKEAEAKGPKTAGKTRLYVGTTAPTGEPHVADLLDGLAEDGYVIHPHGNMITIIGSNEWGTEFGVYEFLERYVGVRWLLPGPDGEDVPLHSTIAVDKKTIRDEPASLSRHFFMESSVRYEWAERNRMNDNIRFHHNMNKLFDPKVFADHPEYYADGVVPTHPYEWQPCFNDTTAAVAIKRINEYFDANPKEMSYSLGINDSGNYCEADPDHPNYPGKTNSLGLLNMSDVYYPWVNKVVEGVLAKHPDKYFGLLAYSYVYDPPTNLKLNSHVIPYITDDRMSWGDPKFRQAGHDILNRWKQAATSFGWYEYLYGTPYNLPRVYPHLMAENYRYAQDNDVIAHVAELYPNFGEGPKPWVSAKLQWNPKLNVDDLLNEWYVRAVGPEAAPYLAQYYDHWEQFWTTRVFDSNWYKTWANETARATYLTFNDSSYLQAVTREEIADSRKLLEKVVSKARTEAQKKRAQLLLRAFDFYEASALSYPRSGETATPSNEQEALRMLDDIEQSLEMSEKRNELMKQFKGNPILELELGPPTYGQSWNGVQPGLLAALEGYTATEPEGGIVKKRLREFMDKYPNLFNLSASAVKTTASKVSILQTLDFSQGPWKDAIPFNKFLVMNTGIEGPSETKVYLLWDDANLYVGYENMDNDISRIIASDDAPDGWWRSGADDSVETYMTGDPQGGYNGFFSNSKAVRFVYTKDPVSGGVTPNTSIDGQWDAKAVVGNDRWNVIQVIPFSSIGVDPKQTKTLNGFFFRNYHGQSLYLGWGGGAPWKPESFNPVQLVEKK